MKKYFALFAGLLSVTVVTAQVDTVIVSVKRYEFNDSQYVVICTNGHPFTGTRQGILELFHSPHIAQPNDQDIAVYKFSGDIYPYRIAIRNSIGVWEDAWRTSLLPSIQENTKGIFITFATSDNTFQLVRMIQTGNPSQLRWRIRKLSDY